MEQMAGAPRQVFQHRGSGQVGWKISATKEWDGWDLNRASGAGGDEHPAHETSHFSLWASTGGAHLAVCLAGWRRAATFSARYLRSVLSGEAGDLRAFIIMLILSVRAICALICDAGLDIAEDRHDFPQSCIVAVCGFGFRQ
jgi:hypothetical protein